MILNVWYEQYKQSSVAWRAKYFRPVLKLLAAGKITPNQITFFRLIFIAPIVFYFYERNLTGVLIFYLLFWLLDLFDGALARYLNKQNDKGRFWDTLVDNFMYGVVMAGFIYLQAGFAWLLGLNILLEYSVQILAIIYKQGNTPSDFIIKAQADLPYFKAISHLSLFLYYLGWNYLNTAYYLLDIVLLLALGYYLVRLRIKNAY